MNKKDQYGKNIPKDLILLTITPGQLTDKEIAKVCDELDWFCFDNNKTKDIFISKSSLEDILDLTDDTATPDEILRDYPIVKIPASLHRNTVKGQFYWA